MKRLLITLVLALTCAAGQLQAQDHLLTWQEAQQQAQHVAAATRLKAAQSDTDRESFIMTPQGTENALKKIMPGAQFRGIILLDHQLFRRDVPAWTGKGYFCYITYAVRGLNQNGWVRGPFLGSIRILPPSAESGPGNWQVIFYRDTFRDDLSWMANDY
jgi:hypothetical protein